MNSCKTSSETSLSNADIIDVLRTISKDNDLYLKPKNSINISMLCGMITVILGALLGIPGLLIGIIVHLIGAYYERNNYKPLSEILYRFSDEKKKLLCDQIKEVLKCETFLDISQCTKCYNDIRDKMIAFLALEYNLISKAKPKNN
ncbi:Hypothetical predicted protein [Octopus vulgaris]|uniref:Uncharacterized protein n=1 Tax=Octopus vulgaris TaxID=6645 RepID=A0AA36F4A4_OCTVU|nr:Hypothetical predicted protein [Octopus vulgaris]